MLIIIAISETLKFPLYGGRRRIGDIHTAEVSNSLSINLFLLLVFSLMGLFLPINKSRSNKIIYTAVEIGLIILMSFLSNLRLSPILCIILVIRDCFIFERKQNLIINIFVFSLFTFIQIQKLHKLTRLPLFARERFILVLLSSIILFGLVIVFLQLLVKAIMSERKSREQLSLLPTSYSLIPIPMH
ncbi:MAG: hypothetical protein F6K18_32050 [Okeania sp. SIO2C2]|uniref:hypothetical protein n=1 Tax=Okeania sp. SIO2C2 TaxID=2607787 RepID=UPI0013BB51F9|nr:hypothetical protein [Okeania sp. SIO2C2]NEP91075.1 hypothetical protein [Okeania sp. SIO2C2]